MAKKFEISSELLIAQREYHGLLNQLSESNLRKKSYNAQWTNGEILFHMLLGFIVVFLLFPLVKAFNILPKTYSKLFARILNFSTPLFNFSNMVGAKIGGRIFSKEVLGNILDRKIEKLLKRLESINDLDLQKGMYYPYKWDNLFDQFMTNEELFLYPIKHSQFHASQINFK